MARVELTVHPVVLSQYALTANETTGTSDDMEFKNTGDQFLYVRNSDGAATRDVTIIANGQTTGGADYEDEVVTVAISGSTLIGPFETAVFNTADNMVEVDLDAGNESDLEVVALSFARAR